MTDPTPLDACFIVNPDINPRSLAPEQRRAKRATYYPTQGFGAFPDDIAQEGGPDRSVYLMGARWEGETGMASQQDDMREGYFISARKTGPWRWVLWQCFWDDSQPAWFWSSAGATSWATKDPATAGREMIRRLWASWGSQGAPQEIDELGLMHRNDIESLIGEVFKGLPASVMEPVEDTEEPGNAPDAVPDVEASDGTTVADTGREPSDSEMLASTSDEQLARLLGISYREGAVSSRSTGTSAAQVAGAESRRSAVLVIVTQWPSGTMAMKFGSAIKKALKVGSDGLQLVQTGPERIFRAETDVTRMQFLSEISGKDFPSAGKIIFIEL